MSQRKRVSRLLVVAIVLLLCGLGLLRWTSGSATSAVAQAPTVLAAVAPPQPATQDLTASAPAPTPAAGSAAAAAGSPPAGRRIGPAAPARAAVGSVVENRWATATTLKEAVTNDPATPDLRHRVRIARTDFKYPLLRIEETLHVDPQTGADTLIGQTAMVADHVLVQLVPGADVSALASLVTSHGGSIRSVKPASKLYLVTISAPLEIDGLPDAIEVFQSAAGVIAIAEPDFIVHTATTPNDPSFGQLYGLHNTGQTGGIADADIDAPEAWAITTGSRSVVVGVIDTGIDHTHPDLVANMWTNPGEIPGNGIDDDGNGYVDDVRGWDFVNDDNNPMDDNRHGTHCAGTIGAAGDNAVGVVGVNWQVGLVGLKFLSGSGSGSTSDAVEAVAYANGLGVDLTSNSWGGGGYSQLLYNVIAEANAAGRLFIAAAGNSSRNTDTSPNYPSGYDLPNIIAVAATDHADQLASFSNYGAVSVDLAAPGVNTLSTTPGGTYQSLSGTSMATPHVAGAAALLLARQPSLAAADLKAALLDSVDLRPALTGRVLTQGRLNVAAALTSLSGLGVSPASGWTVAGQIGATLPATATTFTLRNSGSTAFSWTASSNVTWAKVSVASGALAPGASTALAVTLDANAAALLLHGTHEGVITFTNTADQSVLRRLVRLVLEPITVPVFTEDFESGALAPARWTVTGGANARAVVSTANLPRAGAHHLVMDAITSDVYARNEVTLRLDLTGASDLRLTFWAKGFSDEPHAPPSNPFLNGADFDGVAISTDGITWHEIQPLRSLTSAWQKYTIDLDPILAARGLAYTSAFRIRFNQYDNYPAPTDGIAIDDIAVVRIINKRLGLVSSATLPEGGDGTATVTAAPIPETDVVVQLSEPSGTLVVPASVTLLAGQSSVTFPISALDDTLLNGTRALRISAAASGWASAESVTRVFDNETALLGLVLPASGTEGSTALTGLVTVSPAPDADVIIDLSSDDTDELRVPATTVIAAGQTSANFEIIVVDDNRIDGSVVSAISARVENWTPATASITIHDNETRALSLSSTASVREGDPAFSATVTLSGTLAAPLAVALSTDDPSELAPTAEVIVPAGQLSATFSVGIVDDDLHDGPQSARLIATAPTFTSAETTVVVRDNDAHHLHLSAPPASVLRNQAFALVVTGQDVSDQTVPTYSSTLTFSATDDSGASVPVAPASAPASGFVSGRWSGNVSLGAYANGIRIIVTDTSGRSVTSTPIDVVTGPATALAWNEPPPSITRDTPFDATVIALDAAGNPAPSFSGAVALSVQDNTSGSVRILSWIGYADVSPAGEYENTKRAIRNHFTSFIETSTSVTDATDLAAALAGKDVFLVPEQEADFGNVMNTLGIAWASVLQDFVNGGGTVIVCSQGRQEHLLLTRSGLMTATKSLATTGSHPLAKAAPATWLNEGVASAFTAFSISTYSGSNGQPSISSQLYPYHAVLSREVGQGRVVLIGTDYTVVPGVLDRVIANAVKGARASEITMRAPVRPVSATFVDGVWSGPLSVPILGSNLSLRADTGDRLLTGRSSAFASVVYAPPEGTGLMVTVPASVVENAGSAPASVSLASVAIDPVVITLTSGAPAKLSVPASVTVPAGATSAAFNLTLTNDTLIDGDRDVVVSATSGTLGGSATVRVLDDETGTLTLTAAAAVAENAGAITATLSVNPTAARPISVALTSSEPSAATVPATVVIPAGFSSITFPITAVDDAVIDGDQTTIITASVVGWTAATHTLTVTDNETRVLQFSGATSLDEGKTVVVALSAGGTLSANLVVTLTSADPAQLVVPATVTILAGQQSASFQIQAPDDTLHNGSRTIALSATAATFTAAARDIVVRDDDLHHFGFRAISDARSTHTPFPIAITAYAVDGVAITSHVAPVALSAQAANGDIIPLSPTTTGAFVNGVWTGNVTSTATGTGVRITATHGSATGQSNAFDILNAPRLSASPSAIDLTLHRDEAASREVVITNSGQLPLTWSLSAINASMAAHSTEPVSGPVFAGGLERPKGEDASATDAPVYEAPRVSSISPTSSPWAPRLESVLAGLDAGHAAIRALIPGRYAFSEGVTGNNINDGGNDMYDGGNYLSTDLGSYLSYSDGVLLPSNMLGASGGRYFTRKHEGLFVFAADLVGVSRFDITGDLGADGGGSTDTAVLSVTRGATVYRGFVKRVYGTSDPSVNHLIIVADNGTVTHSASTNTNDDFHRVSGLTGVTRLYYLLYAGGSGGYINNTSAQAVMTAFLDAVSTGEWMRGTPSSGTIAPGESAAVTLTFDSTALDFRTHTQTLRITSNDPLQPTTHIPVSLTVTDRTLHHFAFDPIPSQIRGAPFTVKVRALAADGLPVVSFASPVALSAQGATLTPATTTASGWENGVWTGKVTVGTFGTGITLAANDGAGHTGVSNTFDAGSGPLAGFTWDPVPSPQVANTPFPAVLRATDIGGNPVPSYAGTASLHGFSPQTLPDTGAASSSEYYPFAASYGAVVRQQMLYPASALGNAPRRLSSVALNVVSTNAAASFSNWTIRLKTTTRTSLSSSSGFDSDGWTTVHVSTATPTTAGWTTFVFSSPFDYDGTSALLVDFSFRNPGTTSNYISTSVSYDGSIRCIRHANASATADPFAFTTASAASYVPLLRFASLEPVPLRPSAVNLVDGIWSGDVSLASPASFNQLHASTAAPALQGTSNVFTVSAATRPLTFPFAETWESGTASSAWTFSGTHSYRTQITSAHSPRSGTRHLTLDTSLYSTFSRNEATLTLDLAGRSGVVLSFWAKGFNEGAHAPASNPFTGGADFDGVAISPDGVTWHEVQPLRSPALTNVWQSFTVNLDAALASRGLAYTSAFRIRFNRYGDDPITSDGIALDDISITTSSTGATTVALPPSASESAAPLTGTLSVAASRSTDTAFTLTSSAPAKLTVPAAVTLPGGATSVTFTATPINDTLLDGNHTVAVTATPPDGSGLFAGAATLTITDDDAPAITLAVTPASIAENSPPATATVTLGTAPAAPISLTLSSSDTTAATVPATLAFDPGQTTATFLVTPINDTKIDGPQTTILSATYPGAVPATASFTVTDNETTTLALSVPYSVVEGSSGTGSVSISGTLPTPLTVVLTSANPAQLTVPFAVSIPAGSTSVPFVVRAVDDDETDGQVSVAITASATGFTSATQTSRATDNDLHHFTFTSISTNQIANQPFTLQAYARTIDESAVTVNGTVALSARSSAGAPISVTPATVTFAGTSVATAVTVQTPATGVTLHLDNGAGRTGQSNSFNAGFGTASRIAITPVASPQFVGVPSPVTLTVQDTYGNTVTSFAQPVALSVSAVRTTTGTGTATTDVFPFVPFARYHRAQMVYTPAEVGPAGQLSALAVQIKNPATAPIRNFTIRLKHAASAAQSGWDAEGWTVVHQGDVTLTSSGWIEFPFATPFAYDGQSHLHVDFSHNDPTASTGSSAEIWCTNRGSGVALYSSRLDFVGDPLSWSGAAPSYLVSSLHPNLRFTRAGTIPITPATTPAFVAGTWTGPVTLLAATQVPVVLRATSNALVGESLPFSISAHGNLVVTPAEPVIINGPRGSDLTGQSRTYTLTNTGLASLAWTIPAPPAWLVLSATSGTLNAGESATVTASPSAAAVSLPTGRHFADLLFVADDAPSTGRRLELNVTAIGDLTLAPAPDFAATGMIGGPFAPASATWSIANTGDAPLSWTATAEQAWVSLSPSSGTLAPGAAASVTIGFASAANALPAGDHAGIITVSTADGRGSATRTARVTVLAANPPVITTQPASAAVAYGETAALSVTADSQLALSYQWYRGITGDTTQPITGATDATFTPPALTTSTSYWVAVSNAAGTAASDTATLTVIAPPPPLIIAQPSSATLGYGQTTTLTVSVTSAFTVSYQWYRGSTGDTAQPVTGATSASYTPPALFATTSYWVSASNVGGTAASDTATLTITPPSPPVIIAQPSSVTLDYGQTATLTVSAASAFPVSYQWYRGHTGDTTQPITSATNANYTTPALTASASFWIAVTNIGGTTPSATATITVTPPPPPVITSPPASVTISQRDSAALTVTATGTGTLTYQWYRGLSPDITQPVTGATGPLLVSPPLSTDSVFWVRVSNEGGFADSPPAAVTVRGPLALSVFGAGYNSHGNLGDGSRDDRTRFVYTANNVARLSAHDHTLILKADSTLWGCGDNSHSQLGLDPSIGLITPVMIADQVVDAIAGSGFSLVIKADGSLWAAGRNAKGQLSDGAGWRAAPFVQIATDIIHVAAGESHSLWLKTDGTLWTVGENHYGQLGDNTTADRPQPVQVANGVARVFASGYYSVFLKTDGSLWGMGLNIFGQFGNGTTLNSSTPTLIATDVIDAAAGIQHLLFVKREGSLWAVGAGHSGQLGTGSPYSSTTPLQVGVNVTRVYAQGYHSLFLKADDSLWGMGTNNYGQLADGTQANRNSPIQIASYIHSAASGVYHTLVLQHPFPIFLTEPQSHHVALGESTTLSVIARSSTPATYQWYLGASGDFSQPIPGATHATYTTPALFAPTQYWVVVINTIGSTNSATATVTTVAHSPVIDPEPALTGGTANTLTWSSIAEATAYEIESSSTPDFTAPLSSGWITDLSHTFTSLADGLWSFRVRYRFGTETELFVSPWSPVVTSTQDSVPPLLTITSARNTHAATYTATGTTSDLHGVSAFTINGQPVTTSDDYATWTFNLTLQPGENLLTVLLADTATPANLRTTSFTIAYTPLDADTDGLPDAWETTHGLDITSSAGIHGPAGDPDGDGLPNLLEYAFNTDPRQRDDRLPYSSRVETDPDTGVPHLFFIYPRRLVPGDLVYTVVTSSDLDVWTPAVLSADDITTEANANGLTETVTVRLPATSDRGFVRIHVSTP